MPVAAEQGSLREWVVEAVLVVAAYAVAVYLLYYPAFADPFSSVITGGPGRIQADTYLMLWILSWGSRALVYQPLDFFQGNILHPSPSSLAGAEHMAGYLPLFAPAYYLTGSNVFAFQFTLFFAVVLSGAGMYALLRHWGASRWGATFGGFLMIASPALFRGSHAAQMSGWFYLPVALLYFDRVLERGRLRDGAALAAAFGLQMLCSFYLAYITVAVVGIYGAAVVLGRAFDLRKIELRNLLVLFLAVATGAVAFLVFALPYASRAAAGEIADQFARGIAWYSTAPAWQSYLQSPWFGPFLNRTFYIGIAPALLALYALARAGRIGVARVVGMWLAAFACLVLAAGPKAEFSGLDLPPLYDLFLKIPGFSSIRGPNRFALAVNFSLAALAGLGLSQGLRGVEGRRVVAGLVWLAVVALTYLDFGYHGFEHYLVSPRRGRTLPTIYRTLAKQQPGVLLEVPAGTQRGLVDLTRESQYGYYSTFHWHRILNGYTGYMPETSRQLMVVASALPNPKALDRLVRLTGLDYIAVHLNRLPPGAKRRWLAAEGLELIAEYRNDLLFRVTRAASADLVGRLLQGAGTGQTYGGLPIRQVPFAERSAAVAFQSGSPTRVVARLIQTVVMSVRNQSGAVWPGQGPDSSGAVRWRARWTDLDSGESESELDIAPLPFDLGPGEELRTFVSLPAPSRTGRFRLEVGLAQNGEWFMDRVVVEPVLATGLDRMKSSRGGAP